ncbi:MAG: hypothetical protein ABGZ53_29300, partial [Fuerstiella sp.]
MAVTTCNNNGLPPPYSDEVITRTGSMGDDALMLSLAALINMIVLDRKMKMYRRFVPKSGVQVILVFAISCVATTSDAAELNYNIAPKQVVPYKVNIVATTTSSRDTMTGTIAFTGK